MEPLAVNSTPFLLLCKLIEQPYDSVVNSIEQNWHYVWEVHVGNFALSFLYMKYNLNEGNSVSDGLLDAKKYCTELFLHSVFQN